MPYYCTVPKCTSMAGKAKNVSFHQFPRDDVLARRWNEILKRGKPYTKYSKVCSLHFTPEDYTITTVGKNKGQWRTLRKDATPSQKLPTESPVVHPNCSTSGSSPTQSGAPHLDPQTQQTLAQAIYMHTMLAMQAADLNKLDSTPDCDTATRNDSPLPHNMETSEPVPVAHSQNLSAKREGSLQKLDEPKENIATKENTKAKKDSEKLKCSECSKCFKDPDVFVLHKRGHVKTHSGQENVYKNHERNLNQIDTLRANPILTNLLNSRKNFNDIDVLSMENKIMAAMAFNMNAYVSNLASMAPSGNGFAENGKTESGFPENVKTESGFPVIVKTESGFPENVKTASGFPENVKTESGFLEIVKTESGFPENVKTESGFPENCCPYLPENGGAEVKIEEDFPGNGDTEMDFVESGNSDVSESDDGDCDKEDLHDRLIVDC